MHLASCPNRKSRLKAAQLWHLEKKKRLLSAAGWSEGTENGSKGNRGTPQKRSIVLTSATATTPLLPITSTCLQCKWTNQEASNRKKQDFQLGHKIGSDHIKKNISTYKQGGLNEWLPPGGHTLQPQLDFWKYFPVTGRNELTRRRAAFQSIFLKWQQLCKVKMFCLFFIPIQSQSSPVQSAVTWFRSNQIEDEKWRKERDKCCFFFGWLRQLLNPSKN